MYSIDSICILTRTDILSNRPLNQFIDTSTVGKTTALEFIASELGKDIDLLLMFEPPKVGKLYVDLFPLCWSKHSLLS